MKEHSGLVAVLELGEIRASKSTDFYRPILSGEPHPLLEKKRSGDTQEHRSYKMECRCLSKFQTEMN